MKRQKESNEFKSIIQRIRWKPVIIFVSIILIIVLPITFLSINWSNVSILYATGSSAVFPLMKELSAVYEQNRGDNPPIDLSIESTGSGSGLEKILSNSVNFGNISFSPTAKLVKQNFKQWNALEIKTISWGIDGISLVYKGDFHLDINDKNIDDIYIAFSGLKEMTYESLGVDSNLKIIPFARTGGATKSGTTEAFLENSGFRLMPSVELNKAINMIEQGNYGNNVQTTKESQSETWHQMSISSKNSSGQIAYLSTGFVMQNKEEILNSGFKIATYKGYPLSIENVQSGRYNWRRILNSLISLKDDDKELRTWVNWILLENYYHEDVANVFNRIGIVQLTKTQLNQMKLNGDFWVSDIKLKNPDYASEDFNYGVRL